MPSQTYLAVYNGPGGPISATFDYSGSRAEILEYVNDTRRTWYDDAANALDLHYHASEARIAAALHTQGWELFAAAAHSGAYAVYRLRPLLDRMRESPAFRLVASAAADGYVVAAEWTELGTDGEHDEGAALAEHWVAAETAIVEAFVAQNWADFESYCEQRVFNASEGSAAEHFGHDLWLTRNGHGTGFWDRYELELDVRDRLAAAARALGEIDIECEESEESAEW